MHCDRCVSEGPIHFRVRTEIEPDWQLVCPECWAQLQSQPGYCYGGTRKANRRSRKR